MQDALGLPVHEVLHPDAAPVAIAQVDLPAVRLRNPGGQGHPSPRGLDAILIGAAAKHVRAVCKGSPGQVLEPIPLLQEVVPTVVADLTDKLTVHHANLVEVGCVDDELPACSQDRFQLVHGLRPDPELVVHG